MKIILERRLKHWIEVLFIIFIIILNILDFLEILPPDFDFIKKIISWILLGYMMYKVNLANIIFGKSAHEDIHGIKSGLKIKDIDLIIIISYFLLIFKDMIHYSKIILEEGGLTFTKGIINAIDLNASGLSTVTFTSGGILLLMITIFMALKYDIRAPSIMHIIHEEGDPPKNIKQIFLRFLSIFTILIGFYILVFNLLMEWLAFAVDAPLLVVGIFFYLYLIIRIHKRISPESLLFKIGNFGESFYENFLKLFYTKKGLFLALTGLLVLHLLTDLGNFVLPYTIGIHDSLYFSQLNSTSHQSLFYSLNGESLISMDLAHTQTTGGIFSVIILYFFNLLAISLLLILPAFIWYKSYLNKGFKIPHISISLFITAITIFIIAGVFTFSPIKSFHTHSFLEERDVSLAGVDISTNPISNKNNSFMTEPLDQFVFAVLFLSISIGFFAFVASFSHRLKESIIFISVIIILLFVGYYIFLFSIDYSSSYLENIVHLKSGDSFENYFVIPLTRFYLIIFMLSTIIFYFASYFLYLKEVIQEFKYIK